MPKEKSEIIPMAWVGMQWSSSCHETWSLLLATTLSNYRTRHVPTNETRRWLFPARLTYTVTDIWNYLNDKQLKRIFIVLYFKIIIYRMYHNTHSRHVISLYYEMRSLISYCFYCPIAFTDIYEISEMSTAGQTAHVQLTTVVLLYSTRGPGMLMLT